MVNMALFVAYTENMSAKKLANLMLKHSWKPKSTSKAIVSDQLSVFILQVKKELNRSLNIWLHPSKAYHPRNYGQSEIVNKGVEQYAHYFTQ